MMQTARRIAVIVGMILIAGCNRQDADALAKIGNLLVDRAKSLPAMKPPQAEKKEDQSKPQTKTDERK